MSGEKIINQGVMRKGLKEEPKTLKELSLTKLQFTDNTVELTALAQAGFIFSGTPPRRVDMNPHNKLVFLSDAKLRQEFGLSIKRLLNLSGKKILATYDPTTDIYLDLLKEGDEYSKIRTRYHELGHGYVRRQNPNIHKFLNEMKEKMCGRKYPEYLSEKHLEKISGDQKKQYFAFKTVDEGVSQYIAIEAEAIKSGISETGKLCGYHYYSRGENIILDGFLISISSVHSNGYRNVTHVCRELREAGLNAKEAIGLIIQNPPNDPEYFFWHHDKYAKNLLELYNRK